MNNYPNLFYDYVGATGEHTITDLINTTSNILNTKINNTSNILINEIFIASNILNNKIDYTDLKYGKLIKNVLDNSLNHTYITNSNIGGQIRFQTTYYTNDYRYLTRIKENGELEVYYSSYNPLFPTVFEGWYSVMGSIRDAYNYQNVAGELIGGALLAINDLYLKVYGLMAATAVGFETFTAGELTKERFTEIVIAASRSVNYNRFNQVAAVLGITTLGVAGFAYSVLNGIRYDNITNNLLNSLSNLNLSINSNITQTDKDNAIETIKNDTIQNLIDFNSNLTNLNLLNGFINSNIITSQIIPYISTNTIKLNNKVITTLALKDIDNFVQTQYGTYYDITNGSFAINSTPNQTDFFSVGGQTTIQGVLIVENRIKENSLYLSDIYVGSNQIFKKTDTYSVEQQYPPKLYNTFTSQTTTTFLGQASYQESITLNNTGISYGVGQYDIYVSTSSLATNRAGKQLFNYVLNEEADSCHFTGVYNASGFYVGTADYINSGYYGDWCIIKLPNPIILTKFAFYMRPTQTTRAPSLWKCYGSIDGTTFTEIVEGGNTTALTSGSYTASKYEKILNTSFNTPYNYIGFCYNKITGSGSILNFAEIQIFGKELLETPIYISSNILQIQNYINSNSITNVLTPYISSNILQIQNYINSNSITNVLTPYPNYNYLNSYSSNYISSNILQSQNYINSNSITNVLTNYSSSNAVQNIIMNMTSVCKHTGFYITVSTAIGINSTTYYKYDIDLRKYVSLGVLQIGPGSGDTYRNFKITIYYATNYYSVLTNGILEVTDYQIFMSYKAVQAQSYTRAGLNIAALSSSPFYNPNLDMIPPNNLFLMRNGANSIDYLTVVSKQPADVRVLILDLIG